MKKRFFIPMKVVIVSMMTIAATFVSCSDDGEEDTPVVVEPPIVLECNYFSQNPNAILKDNPLAPIDYVVTCKMAINDDVVIEPGVTIAFETNAGFSVGELGSLNASGTSTKKITFTGTDKTAGSWAGIFFRSNDTKNAIRHSVIEYAGGDRFNSNGDLGNIIVYANSSVEISNNEISKSAAYGINFRYNTGTILNFSDNIFKDNKSPALAHISKINQIKGTNVFEGNTSNKFEILVTGTIRENSTWHKLNIPYLVKSNTSIMHCDISADVIIEPGTVIEMGLGTGMKVNETGSLKLEGTPTERIVIRGEQAVAGYWERIYYTHTQSPNNIINYADIKHGGANPPASKGAIYLWANPRLTIDNTHFSDILACAVNGRVSGGTNFQRNLTIGANVTYTNCGGQVCGD
ncbi:MAG: hypothetical protein Q4G08_05725 [Capnocytophaga sp.]|nr:hypothetical protein [Capnocytophaga sp.]